MSLEVRFKVLSEPEERGNSIVTDVLTEDGSVFQVYTYDERHLGRLRAGAFIEGTYCSRYRTDQGQNIIRPTSKSRLYRGSEFSPSEDALKGYYDAPVVSLGDAAKMEKYQRFSVKGTVTNVSPVKISDKSSRRELELLDTSDRQSKIKINLWKNKGGADVAIRENEIVTIKNIYVKEFKHALSFNSTQHTEVKYEKAPGACTIVIRAFAEEENGVLELLTNQKMAFHVEPEKLLTALGIADLDELQHLLPVSVIVHYEFATLNINKVESCELDDE
ncbi:uncharacterized protein LOC119732907 [Patiria miniata]|uniref:Replication protein A OB domain-containing protein n=1 Tax=Patiria miniata TaxID=46514 RepID=A0A914AEP3_PATMI|nr:uncharacterized protein LOC119732907 [Patiria miniata]